MLLLASRYPSQNRMSEDTKPQQPGARNPPKQPLVSAVLSDGSIVELVYDPREQSTAFAVWEEGAWRFESSLVGESGERLVPYSPKNNIIRNEVVLFPSEPEEYGSEEELLEEIRSFIHRYVDVSSRFEQIASYYVMFSWVYDAFAELPYLRVRAKFFGVGKTRFLLTVGSLCYKPIFASGASTVSPIFHLIDTFRGTLIIDEADFRFSDEKSEIIKIFNNGIARGFPVLRTEVSNNREFNPRAFNVFGPKLVATRGYYQDRALESRFITEEMGQYRLRHDIPISLPQSHKEEARRLRNRLLLFRFRNLGKKAPDAALVDRSIEPRLNQIFVPLMSIVDDRELRKGIQTLAREYNRETVAERGLDIEGQLLEVIRDLFAQSEKVDPSVKNITNAFFARYGEDYQLQRITPKWIGTVLRRNLQLRTQKSGSGAFVIPFTETPKLERLYERYGIVVPEPTQAEGQTAEKDTTTLKAGTDITDLTDVRPGEGPEERQRHSSDDMEV